MEYPDPEARRTSLAQLIGVEDRCWVRVSEMDTPSSAPWNTRSAAVWLASAAAPGAMEAWALARAAASFRPSPTINGLRPAATRASMARALSIGESPPA